MRVLYIEDHWPTVLVLQDRCKGLEIDNVASLRAAKVRLATNRFDVLLADLNLPDSKGMTTARELVGYDIPLVILTGDISSEFHAEAWRLGVADYISKKHLLDIDIAEKLREAHENYQRIKHRYSSISYGNLDAVKQYITPSPFAAISSSNARQTVAA